MAAATRLNRAQLQAISEAEAEHTEPTHISARVKGNIQLIPVNTIYFFQAEQKYVTVGYIEGEVLIEDSLLSLEKRFPRHFMRIHRNALVAIDQISALEKDKEGHSHIKLKSCDKVLEVSRRHLPGIRKFMKR